MAKDAAASLIWTNRLLAMRKKLRGAIASPKLSYLDPAIVARFKDSGDLAMWLPEAKHMDPVPPSRSPTPVRSHTPVTSAHRTPPLSQPAQVEAPTVTAIEHSSVPAAEVLVVLPDVQPVFAVDGDFPSHQPSSSKHTSGPLAGVPASPTYAAHSPLPHIAATPPSKRLCTEERPWQRETEDLRVEVTSLSARMDSQFSSMLEEMQRSFSEVKRSSSYPDPTSTSCVHAYANC